MAKKPQWTRYRIQEALAALGTNLTKLAKDEGLWESACREAVSTSGNTRGQQLISRTIGVPIWELWPQKYPAPIIDANHSRNERGAESQKRGTATHKAEARPS